MCRRLLAPRVIHKPPEIGDFIVHANQKTKGEGDVGEIHDMALNPVVQARFLMEKELANAQGGRRNFAAGALRKLGINVEQKKEVKDYGLQRVDVALMQDEKRAKAEMQAAALKQREEEAMLREAKAAAKEAKRMR